MTDRSVRLYFLRHGAAADADTWRGSDFDRPLTDQGRERIALESHAIKHLNLALDRIVTSPFLRAKQTAAIVADVLKMQTAPVEDERLGANFGVEPLAGVLCAHPKECALMLVGHEPTFSATIGRLIGGAALEVKTGSLARVDLSDTMKLTGKLIWLAPPSILVLGQVPERAHDQ
jgi:phosphohistidine phosphatase